MWTPEDRRLVGDYGAGQALSDDQFRLIEPLIPPPKPGGRPRTTASFLPTENASLLQTFKTGSQSLIKCQGCLDALEPVEQWPCYPVVLAILPVVIP